MKTDLKIDAHQIAVAVYRYRILMIQRMVCDYYAGSVSDSMQDIRSRSSIFIRQLVHYLCHELIPKCPLHVIGHLTGKHTGVDHATVIYSHKVVSNEMKIYPEIRKQIEDIRKKIRYQMTGKRKRLGVHYRKNAMAAKVVRRLIKKAV